MAGTSIRVGINPPANPPLGEVRMLMRMSRAIGMDIAMFWDHFQDFFPQHLWNKDETWFAEVRQLAHEHYDYQVLMGYLANYAGNMRVGVGVTHPLLRHPVLIAQAMLTLSHMTKRPPVLGIGTGERENLEPYGIPLEKPVGKVEEALQIIRKCFAASGPFDFDGQHFQLKNAMMDLQPLPGKTPPIWIAAHGPRMLRLAGQYGDGWYPTMVPTPDTYAAMLTKVHEAASQVGRNPENITASMVATIFPAPTEYEALEFMNSRIGRYLGLLQSAESWKRFGADHPFGESFRGVVDVLPEEIERGDLEKAIEQVPIEFMRYAFLWGPADRIARGLHEFGEAGLQHVVLTPASALHSRRIMYYLPRALWSIRRKLQ